VAAASRSLTLLMKLKFEKSLTYIAITPQSVYNSDSISCVEIMFLRHILDWKAK
jgi:hypothetical protein